jgi:hypothetical protein
MQSVIPVTPVPNIAFGRAKVEGPFALSKVQVLALTVSGTLAFMTKHYWCWA